MNKINYGKITLLLASAILGFLLVFQMKQNIQDYDQVSLKSIQIMKNDINNKRKDIEDMRQLIEQRKRELTNFEEVIKDQGDITEILKKEVSEAKLAAGLEDVQGPGIYLVIKDNESTDIVGADINDDIVHDVDMQVIINDLKSAGAEAISINGQRVLSRSEIKCGGPIIRINGQSMANPFVVKAIGDPKVLYAAINAPNTYGYNLKNIYQLGVETEIKDNIYIPRYWGVPKFNYAKPIKEGE